MGGSGASSSSELPLVDGPEQQFDVSVPIVWTQRDLYAVIGELFVKNQMADLQLAQMLAELAARPVVNSTAEESENADGKP